jgi:hypothetical protein
MIVQNTSASDEWSVVYFIQDTGSMLIKIGQTTDVKRRLSALQGGNANTLIVLGTVIGGQATERALHEQFKANHVVREWYRPHPDLMAFIQRLATLAYVSH